MIILKESASAYHDLIADELICARKRARLKMRDVTKIVGMSDAFMNRTEHKQRRLKVGEFAPLCAALGVSPYYILREVIAYRNHQYCAPFDIEQDTDVDVKRRIDFEALSQTIALKAGHWITARREHENLTMRHMAASLRVAPSFIAKTEGFAARRVDKRHFLISEFIDYVTVLNCDPCQAYKDILLDVEEALTKT